MKRLIFRLSFVHCNVFSFTWLTCYQSTKIVFFFFKCTPLYVHVGERYMNIMFTRTRFFFPISSLAKLQRRFESNNNRMRITRPIGTWSVHVLALYIECGFDTINHFPSRRAHRTRERSFCTSCPKCNSGNFFFLSPVPRYHPPPTGPKW